MPLNYDPTNQALHNIAHLPDEQLAQFRRLKAAIIEHLEQSFFGVKSEFRVTEALFVQVRHALMFTFRNAGYHVGVVAYKTQKEGTTSYIFTFRHPYFAEDQ